MPQTLSGEDYNDTEKLGRQPEKGEWAYVIEEGGHWMKGPNLPSGPVAKEMVLSKWKDEDNRKNTDRGPRADGRNWYVDLSFVAPYMEHVFALHTPDGCVYDIGYELINDLEPGTPYNNEEER